MKNLNFFNPTVMFALALMAVIIMMVLPMPAFVLDLGLAVSFALAILIFTNTLFIERPLDFSAFPSILLASLTLRLSLNISSTKLIIGQGHTGTSAAGNVIEGFADFVMSGSVMLGLVVFCVLLIVNFIVINKGATRMAEVGARFALDAMPGKQLAIDSDLSAGAITHAEAKERREREQAETTFFGSLDGASKFVKGDAIAGLLITGLNLIVGLTIGVFMYDMQIGTAFNTYAILTVGDGLVSQIPAVIISIASALLLARSGSNKSTDFAIISQLSRYPAAIATVAGLMAIFGLVPGLPFIPFMTGAVILGFIAWNLNRKSKIIPPEPALEVPETSEPSMGDLVELDELHVEFSVDLIDLVLDPATGLDARINSMRQHVAKSFGLILPSIRLTDNETIKSGEYIINIHGAQKGQGTLYPHKVMVLLPSVDTACPAGQDTLEPVYHAPARWISKQDQGSAVRDGLTAILPAEVLATHLLETVKQNLSQLMTWRSLRVLLDELTQLSDAKRADSNRKLIDELIPDKISMSVLLAVLRSLLEEQVSIRNMPLILETISEHTGPKTSIETMCEYVRQRLGAQIVIPLKDQDGNLPLVQLAPEWEDIFNTYQSGPDRTEIALPPEQFRKLGKALADKIQSVNEAGSFPVVVTSMQRRRFLRTMLQSKGLSNPVISFEEIGLHARPALLGTVPA